MRFNFQPRPANLMISVSMLNSSALDHEEQFGSLAIAHPGKPLGLCVFDANLTFHPPATHQKDWSNHCRDIDLLMYASSRRNL
jgi:hypothetical protein